MSVIILTYTRLTRLTATSEAGKQTNVTIEIAFSSVESVCMLLKRVVNICCCCRDWSVISTRASSILYEAWFDARRSSPLWTMSTLESCTRMLSIWAEFALKGQGLQDWAHSVTGSSAFSPMPCDVPYLDNTSQGGSNQLASLEWTSLARSGQWNVSHILSRCHDMTL